MENPEKAPHSFVFWINQIRDAGENHKIYFIALTSALTIPDVCGALESETGVAKKEKYAAWFDTWVGPRYQNGFDGEYCCGLRNTMLHQGRLNPEKQKFSRVAFVEPGAGVYMHGGTPNNILTIDLMTFVDDMTQGAIAWFEKTKNTQNFKNNYQYSMRRYAMGMEGVARGVPIIT